ncbi:glycosyl hydrolase [Carboxylicivirga linearis]|uniref:PKD domain-containing protein n=1 Tax=Carboxylicivirga linearis TaxID=1628157 RepID=A0ABS5JXR3_9BACT|nr:glycosyl hydrolase [Carboxylicivirga linearis]MBS2099689.1 PKD domain-containing protein [Carboxylicivirga linearis]
MKLKSNLRWKIPMWELNLKLLASFLFLIVCFAQPETIAQNDVTDLYLTNAGFNINCNYLVGGTETVATADPANTHSIDGWSLTSASAWSAAATFEFGWSGDFNGVTIPSSGYDGANGTGQGAIGLTAGWGGDLVYNQEVILPPGLYEIQFATAFMGANGIAANLNGWIGNDGNNSFSGLHTIAVLGAWQIDTVPIRIVSQTTGIIQVGMRPYQSGSTSNARVLVDFIKLISLPVDKTELQFLVDSANVMLLNPEPVPEGSIVYEDLQTAMDDAHLVLDNGASSVEAILTNEDILMYAIANVHSDIFEATLTTYNNYTATYSSLVDENIKLTGSGQLTLTSATSPMINSAIDLASPDAWVYFENMRPAQVISNYLNRIKANGEDAVVGTNIRIINYLKGAMVIAHSSTYAALTVFDGSNQSGSSMDLYINQYYKSVELGAMVDNIESFVLKRGYMATFASNEDGTGSSRVFIADDSDVVIDLMPTGLSNTVSMVVVRQWRWTMKKGWRGSSYDADRFNCGSYYDYNNTSYGTPDLEFVPMRHNPNWNAYSNFLDKFGSTHALYYNEPDNSVDDGYSTVADAIANYPNMLASGLRVGSPATTDGGLWWLYDFMDQCDALGYRVDFVAWHFYRANYTAQQLYDQLLAIHERTGRPIWITEFNNGCNWTYDGNEPSEEENAVVIQEFITMLENAPFVERYFVWDGCNESLRMTNYDGTLKPAGIVYRDQESSMAYTEDYYNDCEPAIIDPWVQINGGSWNATTDVVVNAGDEIRFGPQPFEGTWSWTGCGTSGTSREQVIYPTSSCSATATNTSSCGAQSSVTYNITVNSSNVSPTADFSFSINDLTVDFDASASFDSDGSIINYQWVFGDGNTGVGQITSYTYSNSGDYTVTLTVTDDDGATGEVQNLVSISGGIANTMYVESITLGLISQGKGKYTGTATVGIVDNNGNAVTNATVSGTFNGSLNETLSGVTGSDGSVIMETSYSKKGSNIDFGFCVDDVTHSNLVYNSVLNNVTCSGVLKSSINDNSIDEEIISGIIVYPNPVKSELNIKISDDLFNNPEIIIKNVLGQVVYRKSDNNSQLIQINLDELADGVYFVIISNGISVVNKTIIKE